MEKRGVVSKEDTPCLKHCSRDCQCPACRPKKSAKQASDQSPRGIRDTDELSKEFD